MEQTAILKATADWVIAAMGENDPAHAPQHVERVVQLTKRLCAVYPSADPFRAELLAWLHDMNDDKLSSDRGLGAVEAFLRSIGTGEAEIRFVLAGIPYISYRKHPKLDSSTPMEIRIVQDADRIDAMGALGVARTFAYGGANDRSLEESLQHFNEKLLRLYDLLSTEEAKVIAKPRHEFLVSFYRQFRRETAI